MVTGFSGRAHVFTFVLDDAVNDRGLAMTSSFTNMVIAGQCLAHVGQLSNYEKILNILIRLGGRLLEPAASLAAKTAAEDYSLMCFVGSGALKAVARESALKVLELTAGRILTMSESFLGIRHGPLSALNKETLVVGFLSGDERRRKYELDLLAEMSEKQVMKKLITVCPGEPVNPAHDLRLFLNTPENFSDNYRPPLDVIFGQLLGLFSSLRHELKPDTPSPNGAISRVVSQVNIY
jgi:tagatose-6-phosphate ketose/aldose isomerase